MVHGSVAAAAACAGSPASPGVAMGGHVGKRHGLYGAAAPAHLRGGLPAQCSPHPAPLSFTAQRSGAVAHHAPRPFPMYV